MTKNGLRTFRQQLGLAFIHLATQSKHLSVRKLAVSTLEAQNTRTPQLLNDIIRVAIPVHLTRTAEREKSKAPELNDDVVQRQNLTRSLVPVLSACAAFADEDELLEKERLITDLVLLAHQPEICMCFHFSLIKK